MGKVFKSIMIIGIYARRMHGRRSGRERAAIASFATKKGFEDRKRRLGESHR